MIKNIIVHHSGGTDFDPLQDSSNYTVAMCNSDHKIRFNMKSSLGWYVGYHYFIDRAGKITQTRIDTEEGAHCKGYNNTSYDKVNHPETLSVGICLAGNFDGFLPTEAQISSLKGLLKQLVDKYRIDPKNIVPHRNHAYKTCYGNKLKESWARELLIQKTVQPIPTPVVSNETWKDKFHKLMLESGFVLKNGKYVWNR